MIDRYLSIWEIAHRWRDANPDKTDPADLTPNVQDAIRYICRGVMDGAISITEPVLMSPNGNAAHPSTELRQYFVNETPPELEDCLYRKYDKIKLSSLFVEANNFFEYCLDDQVTKSTNGNTVIDFPDCWWPFLSSIYSSVATSERTKKHPLKVGKREKNNQELWEPVEATARALWAEEGDSLHIAAAIKRIKNMTHLKASGLSDSAIRKHIANLAPENVRGISGRKHKKST